MRDLSVTDPEKVGDGDMKDTHKEQYKQLCSNGRHYDQKLWLVPSAAYAVSALLYSIIFSPDTPPIARLFLSVASAVIFSGFIFQYVKDRAFQLEGQAMINEMHELYPDLLRGSEYSGALKGDPKDRWFIRVTRRQSAANFVFYIMLTTLMGQAGVALYWLLRTLCVLKP
jgi:hypothetical protein